MGQVSWSTIVYNWVFVTVVITGFLSFVGRKFVLHVVEEEVEKLKTEVIKEFKTMLEPLEQLRKNHGSSMLDMIHTQGDDLRGLDSKVHDILKILIERG